MPCGEFTWIKPKLMNAIVKHSSLHAKHIVPHPIKYFFFLPKTILHFNVTSKIASRYRASFSILLRIQG